MKVLCVTGIGGGTGVTTVAAQLAAALKAQDRPVVAFDFSPDNTLRLHFGMALNDDSGLAPQVLSGQAWNEVAYRSANGVDFVPFGNLDEAGLNRFGDLLAQQPDWLSRHLDELDLPADALVVLDCPRTFGPLWLQALAAATLVLIVLAPDALSFARAKANERSMRLPGDARIKYLFNGFDASRDLDRDVVAVVRSELQEKLVPVMLHRDEHLREALASKRDIYEYAPSSQAAQDFSSLAQWLAKPMETALHP
jgi:cellulose synthase operon protein YhjQ